MTNADDVQVYAGRDGEEKPAETFGVKYTGRGKEEPNDE